MSKFLAVFGSRSGAVVTAAVSVAVVAGAAWVQFGGQNNADVTTVVAVAPAVAPLPPEAKVPAEAVAEVVEAPVEPNAPAFDEVRREADGMTVIAGRAKPGASVQILQNGAEISTTTADGSGKFAALTMIAPDGNGHVLSLLQTAEDTEVASLDEIILAPLAAPVVAAEQETGEDAPEPAGDADVEPAVLVEMAESKPLVEVPDVAIADDTSEIAVSEAVETAALNAPPVNVAQVAAIPAETIIEAPVVAPDVAQTSEVAVLKSTAEGVELLNPTAPEVMDNVALDTISYSLAGDVQLSGRAQADTRAVRVYLNNNAVVSLDVASDGRWRGDLPNVDEGIYTLRVDEVASDGRITSRVETPFKREAPEVLAAASARQSGPIKAITVQKGATLWAIARDRYGRGDLFVRVFEANKDAIRDADLIYPGQVFDLPD
jgi:nucleoid-associated protein YgaU